MCTTSLKITISGVFKEQWNYIAIGDVDMVLDVWKLHLERAQHHARAY